MWVFVFASSSGAAPYMGAYEVFKTAQVELANTLSAEIQDSGVYASLLVLESVKPLAL
jgi:hypothetical protein